MVTSGSIFGWTRRRSRRSFVPPYQRKQNQIDRSSETNYSIIRISVLLDHSTHGTADGAATVS